MKIKHLKLTNFRNYQKLDLKFNENLNIIYGKNGMGKTNLVEAIYTLALTKSFRTNDDQILIKKDEVSTKIEGEVETNTNNNYEVVINELGKKVKIDGNIISKLSDYVTNINIVLLEPEEQMIFSSSPSERRKLLNIEISQLKKHYISYLNNYNHLLKQRNSYLKDLDIVKNENDSYLEIITNKLIEYGLKIYEFRESFIKEVNNYINKKYQDVFKKGTLEVKYTSDYQNKTKEEIYNIYKKNFKREVLMGKTLQGVHHDDMIFYLDGNNIIERGSNGQKKNAIFAFKLAEIEIIYQEKGNYPILILDDLFSALDNEKIKNIIKILNNNIQTFITTTDLEKVDKILLKDALLINISEGEVKES